MQARGLQVVRTVLVVDDGPTLARLVRVALEPAGFRVVGARPGAEAVDALLRARPALVILDMEQSEGDGVAVCQSLRELADVPVIFLSPVADDQSKVRGLRCADDYVTQPFSLAELQARVEAVLRRAKPCLAADRPAYDDGLLSVDFANRRVRFAGADVPLTPTEYQLLANLVRNRGRVLLHDELLARVWGETYRGDRHLLRLHVANLRRKIEPDPARPRYVRNQRGLGYIFDPQARPSGVNGG